MNSSKEKRPFSILLCGHYRTDETCHRELRDGLCGAVNEGELPWMPYEDGHDERAVQIDEDCASCHGVQPGSQTISWMIDT